MEELDDIFLNVLSRRFLPPSQIECWRKFVIAVWHLVKFFNIEQKCKELLCVSFSFPFYYTTVSSAFREREMLAEVQYFLLLHTIALPGDSALITDLLTCLLWPMIHQKRNHFGKPVEV